MKSLCCCLYTVGYMKNIKNVTNKEFNKDLKESTYDIGLKGQNFVELKFQKAGYVVYKKNFKKIGLEIDLIVYKYIQSKNLLIIRIAEVKTKRIKSFSHFLSKDAEVELENFGISNKWMRVRKMMFNIVDDIKSINRLKDTKHKISFDLAIVYSLLGAESFRLHKYIENVNLLL
jgi:hypothetical protein